MLPTGIVSQFLSNTCIWYAWELWRSFYPHGFVINIHKVFQSYLQDSLLISQRLENLKTYSPPEFARRPRAIHAFSKYKATAFCQFLLYTGLIVTYVLNQQVYTHFLFLHIAIRILVSTSPSKAYLLNLLYKNLLLDVRIFMIHHSFHIMCTSCVFFISHMKTCDS